VVDQATRRSIRRRGGSPGCRRSTEDRDLLGRKGLGEEVALPEAGPERPQVGPLAGAADEAEPLFAAAQVRDRELLGQRLLGSWRFWPASRREAPEKPA